MSIARFSKPRVALTLLLLINLMNYVDRQLLSAVEKPIGDEFHVGPDRMGMLSSAFLISYMIFAPIFGALADRVRRWWIVAGGVVIWSLASAGTGLMPIFGLLVLMRCVIGIGEAAYGPVAPTIIADLYPIDARGKVLAWFYAAIPVGSALGYVLGGLLNDRWHIAFLLTLPPGLALAVWCFLMPEPQRAKSVKTRANKADYLALLRNRSYMFDTLGMAAMTFAVGGISFFMPRYLEEVAKLDPHKSTSTFGAITAGMGLIATLAGGIVGDRLRRKFSGSYFLVSGIGMLVAAPMLLLMLYTPFPACWGVIAVTVFFLFFNTGPTNTILANVTTPAVRASAFAVNILIIHLLGDALSPWLIGKIAVVAGWRIAFGTMSVVILLGGILWLIGARFLEADTIAVETAGAEITV